MGPRTTGIIVLLGAAAIGSWYLGRAKPEESDLRPSIDPAERGYYLKQARILGTGENGSLLYEIRAEHAEQADDKDIQFRTVHIRYAPDSDIPWEISADTATLCEGAPRIELSGHVQIVSNAASPEDETEIRTQYLEFDPERFIAETNDRVQIRFGSRSVTATGMLASLNDDRIELKSNVRGKIAP